MGLGVSFSRYDTHVTLKEPPPGVAYAVSGPSHGASYQLGPAAAYRVPIGERVSLVGQASVSYTRADSTGSVSLELDGLAAAGGVGLSWFVVDRVSLDGTLAYQWTRYGDPGSRTTTSGVTAFVGASLYLGGS